MYADEFLPVARQIGLIIAYTDGSCHPNPGGRGGWGVHLRAGDSFWEFRGGEPGTTNNRMELRAAIVALEQTPTDIPLRVFSDSRYVVDGAAKWLRGWKARGWHTGASPSKTVWHRRRGAGPGSPVKNRDLWEALDALMTGRTVEWVFVKGHTGHVHNERADQLAGLGRRRS